MQVIAVNGSLIPGREGPQRDLDKLVEGVLDILHARPLGAEDEATGDVVGQLVVDPVAGPRQHDRVPHHDELTGPVSQLQDQVVFDGEAHQTVVVDRLDIIARGDATGRACVSKSSGTWPPGSRSGRPGRGPPG